MVVTDDMVQRAMRRAETAFLERDDYGEEWSKWYYRELLIAALTEDESDASQ